MTKRLKPSPQEAHATVNDEESGRLWGRVHKTAHCWLWTGTVDGGGYGHLQWGKILGKAHRMSWVIANGPIPPGLHVCHTCDIRACVNPDHLFLGTHKDNVHDCMNKGRRVWRRGSSNSNAKFTEKEALEIIALRGTDTHSAIGRRYGITHSAVRRIQEGKTWKHATTKALWPTTQTEKSLAGRKS